MLEIKEIYKTFNAGTINEKRAMNGVSLTLNSPSMTGTLSPSSAATARASPPCSTWWPASIRWTAAPSSSTDRT